MKKGKNPDPIKKDLPVVNVTAKGKKKRKYGLEGIDGILDDFNKSLSLFGLTNKQYDDISNSWEESTEDWKKVQEVMSVVGIPIGMGDGLSGAVSKFLKPSNSRYLSKIDEFFKNYKNSKSEINWGKWNKEIPDNPQLMKEYNKIEQVSKANGTWMKNPNGSAFQGTPEQFVQANSENFKKAFPDGYSKVWRGANNDSMINRHGRSVFSANRDLASKYVGDMIKDPINPNAKGGKGFSTHGRNLLNLAHKKSTNSFELNFNEDYWTNLPLQSKEKIQAERYSDLKQYLDEARYQKKTNPELYNNLKETVNDKISKFRRRTNNFRNVKENDAELLKTLRSELGETTVTDNIAKYLEKHDIDFAKLNNINDSGLGDVTIVNHKSGNYLKSLIGNNGMFNMTNPDIYKSLVPGTIAAGIALKDNDMKKKKTPKYQTGGGLTDLMGFLPMLGMMFNGNGQDPTSGGQSGFMGSLGYLSGKEKIVDQSHELLMQSTSKPYAGFQQGGELDEYIKIEKALEEFRKNRKRNPVYPKLSLNDVVASKLGYVPVRSESSDGQSGGSKTKGVDKFWEKQQGGVIDTNVPVDTTNQNNNKPVDINTQKKWPEDPIGKYREDMDFKKKEYETAFAKQREIEDTCKNDPNCRYKMDPKGERVKDLYTKEDAYKESKRVYDNHRSTYKVDGLLTHDQYDQSTPQERLQFLDLFRDSRKSHETQDSTNVQQPQKQMGGLINSTGYTPGTKSMGNPMNIIPSNNITMKNTPFPVLGIPNKGIPKVMQPGMDYKFGGASSVMEIPMHQKGDEVDTFKSHLPNNTHTLPEVLVSESKPYKHSSCVTGMCADLSKKTNEDVVDWKNRNNLWGNAWDILDKARGNHIDISKGYDGLQKGDLIVMSRGPFKSDKERNIPEENQHIGAVEEIINGVPYVKHYIGTMGKDKNGEKYGEYLVEPIDKINKKFKYKPSKAFRLTSNLGPVASLQQGGFISQFQLGGPVELSPIQTEKGEMLIWPTGDITNVKATKLHKNMDKNHVTDLVPGGQGVYVASNFKPLTVKKDEVNFGMGMGKVEYDENMNRKVQPKEVQFNALFGNSKKLTPAEIAKRIQNTFPTTDREDTFATRASGENKQSRAPYLEILQTVNDYKREGGTPQFKQGGYIPRFQEGGDDDNIVDSTGDWGGLISSFANIGFGISNSLTARNMRRRGEEDAKRFEADALGNLNKGTALGMGAAMGSALSQDPYVNRPDRSLQEATMRDMNDKVPSYVRNATANQINRPLSIMKDAAFKNSSNFGRSSGALQNAYSQTLNSQSQAALQYGNQDVGLRNQYLSNIGNLKGQMAQEFSNQQNQIRTNRNTIFGNLFGNVGNLGINHYNQDTAIKANSVNIKLAARGQQQITNQINQQNVANGLAMIDWSKMGNTNNTSPQIVINSGGGMGNGYNPNQANNNFSPYDFSVGGPNPYGNYG